MTRAARTTALVCAPLLALLAACGGDDGGSVRNLDPSSSAGSGSGVGSGSGSGSGTGLSAEDLSQGSDDPLVAQALTDYSAYVTEQVAAAITLTKTFTDAVRAGDVAAAQAAYAPSRVPWERIEPIAGLVEEIDGAVDARVDDYASVDDPAFTGWHRLEHLVFAQGTTAGGAPFADQLDADLARLQTELAAIEIPAAAVPVGASELIEEVSLGKITGEEDRYSKTDLWDFGANVEGSEAAIRFLTPALQEADATLLGELQASFAALNGSLAPLRQGDGWVLYCREADEFPSPRCPGVTVPPATVQQLQAQLAALSEQTASVAGALGLA